MMCMFRLQLLFAEYSTTGVSFAVWVSFALCRGSLERRLQSLLRRAAAGVRPPSRETARVDLAVARAAEAEAVARAAAGRPRSRKRTFLPRFGRSRDFEGLRQFFEQFQ